MKLCTGLTCALSALAVLAMPAAAAGQATVQAVDGDGTPTDPPRWTPPEVTIKAGETVTWTFPVSNAVHNVASDSPNWTLTNPISASHPAVTHPFPNPGTYRFVCEAHRDTMFGTVTVTDASGAPPPPPPPPPLSQQPWPNDQAAAKVFEVADEKPPALTRVRIRRVARGARVRFRVSERARVTVRFKRVGVTVKRARRTFRAGTHRMTVRDRRMRGRYRIEVLARDLAGNRSRVMRTRLTVRG